MFLLPAKKTKPASGRMELNAHRISENLDDQIYITKLRKQIQETSRDKEIGKAHYTLGAVWQHAFL